MKRKVEIFDSTLRDGCQGEGISYSVKDKIKVVKALGELGVDYIEAGNPTSNPKDIEFFEALSQIKGELADSKLVAFGSTRRKGTKVAQDKSVAALQSAATDCVAIFGKSWDLHVTDVLGTTLSENLLMISDTVSHFKSLGKEVIYDAEHFFDGFKANAEYAVSTLEAAKKAGADTLVLCDTNGGCFPDEIGSVTAKMLEMFPDAKIGIHCHNDCGVAVANSLSAVAAGACQVQGTLLGFGERCGNANLSTLIPAMQLKLGIDCIDEENLSRLTEICGRVAEITNIKFNKNEPFVGRSAFAHKAGMHADGVNKSSHSFEHIDPAKIGNERRFLISEMAGRTSLLKKINKIAPSLTKDSPETAAIIDRIKALEYDGYQFEGAEGSFELIVRKQLGKYMPFFDLMNYTIVCDYPESNGVSDRVTIKIMVEGEVEMTAAEGNGPVNALDTALRKALERFYPNVKTVSLVDYKVRVLESTDATASKVRVLIESTDRESSWTTIGVSTDIIQASWIALVDSIEYKLIKDLKRYSFI